MLPLKWLDDMRPQSPIPTLEHVVVVGAGIIGLSAALLLAEDGFKITIIARDLPGDDSSGWASPWAGANLVPPPEMGNGEMAKASYRWYRALASRDPSSSVRIVKATEYFTDRTSDDTLWYKNFFPKYTRLAASEIPSHCTLGISYETCIVNPDVFLPWLKTRLEDLGATFIRAELSSLSQVKEFVTNPSLIINASGLGAARLAQDATVTSYRGQTMLIKSDYNEVKMIQGSEYTYVIPRTFSGGVIIGGVSQEHCTDTTIDTSLRADILRRVNRMTNGAFTHVDLNRDLIRDIVGLRPGREGGIRIGREGNVIHAYGFKGAGYIFSFGAAAEVKRLVGTALAHSSRARL